MNFYNIGALKVFSEIGKLIDDDIKQSTKFSDLPTDIIHIEIAKFLLDDKKINKIFNEKEDYNLLAILFGKHIPNLTYVKPGDMNEYKTNINLECIKNYVHKHQKINSNSLKVFFRVNNRIAFDNYIIKMFKDDEYLGFITNVFKIEKINKKKDEFLCDKECQDTMKKLGNEIKEYLAKYRKN